jgi:hypothetical protein
MSVESELIEWALDEASKPGDVVVPDRLLRAAEADLAPIAALSDMERSNALFVALTEGFEFFAFIRATQKLPTKDTQDKLVSLLRWVIHACHNWTQESDPKRAVITSIFVITRYCENGGPIWRTISAEVANDDLQRELSYLLANSKLEFGLQDLGRSPAADRIELDRLKKADEEGDWQWLAERLRWVDLRMVPTTFVNQAVQYLLRFDRKGLVAAASAARQTIYLLQILEPLSDIEGCDLAVDSNNVYCEFAAMYKASLTRNAREDPGDSPERQKALSCLIEKVGRDSTKWDHWMLTFNRHPMWFSRAALALGQALAELPESAFSAYIDSIVLTTMRSRGREVVAETLGAFRGLANLTKRQMMWTLAHERWKLWNFGTGDVGIALINTAHSEVDYALVGYAIECITDAARQQELEAIRSELSALELTWFKDVSAFGKAKNVLLSRFQPYAHAALEPDNWLAANNYTPVNAEKDRYAALAFGVI